MISESKLQLSSLKTRFARRDDLMLGTQAPYVGARMMQGLRIESLTRLSEVAIRRRFSQGLAVGVCSW